MTRAAIVLTFAWAAACTSEGGMSAPQPAPVCQGTVDCDDGLFCNGRELCQPGAAGANEFGCLSGVDPCGGEGCREADSVCVTDCPDMDGDGTGPIACGGLDCDDADPNRFGGNVEVCDAAGVDEDCNPETVGARDLDGDGVTAALCCNGGNCGADCDDTRRDVSPGSAELCDEIDNDCDGRVDEELKVQMYLDADLDGVGDEARPVLACPSLPGASPAAGDCDDTRASVRPTGPEICDGLDNDCDGEIDEVVTVIPWYVDDDGDGWGRVSADAPSVDSCAPLAGRALRIGDCDDGNPAISPSSPELCNGRDDDCDGRADFTIAPGNTEDDDRDGVPDAACGLPAADCNDADPLTALETTPELCDGFDNDCDGTVDEDARTTFWYVDMDGDRFGDDAVPPVESCEPLVGRTTVGGDCDDLDGATYPEAADSCDGRVNVDDDCDGEIDEGGTSLLVYPDLDGDGFGDGIGFRSCLLEARTATRDGDCDDSEAAVNPDALDDCAGLVGVDDDCDTRVDETLTPRLYYSDADGDGHGAGVGIEGCAQPPGTSISNRDCDDSDPFRHPDMADDCLSAIGVDDDCDGSTDEGRALQLFYLDQDSDGVGAGPGLSACEAPPGRVAVDGDCDDSDPLRNPAAPDDCSRPIGVDDDCDGRTDEGASFSTFYRDIDGDGYGNGSAVDACGTPVGYAIETGDCDETSIGINPGRADDCSGMMGVDDDCSGVADDAVVLLPFYPDADGDGYGTGTPMMACSAPPGHGAANGDCDESTPNRNPGRADDCATSIGLDDDCDGDVDEGASLLTFFRDADEDGYGVTTDTTLACVAPDGYDAVGGDCDDGRMGVSPGATEVCANGLDDDCDGNTDCDDDECGAGCGTMMVLSGADQAAPVHTLVAAPIVVRIVDGGGAPLPNRSVTLSSASVTAAARTVLTDANGDATFSDVRAGYMLGAETVRFDALGVASVTTTVTASTPAVGTIFSVLNGERSTIEADIGGPVWDASVASLSGIGWLTAGSDGSVYLTSSERILHVDPSGRIDEFAALGCCGTVLPRNDETMRAADVRISADAHIALDETNDRLVLAAGCGIYAIDLDTDLVSRVLGDWDNCTSAGDGGAARDASAVSILDIVVNDAGLIYFMEFGSPTRLRFIDGGGAVRGIVALGDGSAGVTLGAFFHALASIPGSSDVLLGVECSTPAGGTAACIVRTSIGGELTHVSGSAFGNPDVYDIPATTAQTATVVGMSVTNDGAVWFSDANQARILRIDPDGTFRRVAGVRLTPGDTGDGGPAEDARVSSARGVATWRSDHIIFLDVGSAAALRAIW